MKKNKNESITVNSRINWNDELQAIASFLSPIDHNYFVQRYVHNEKTKDIKREFIAQYGITGRYFDSVRIKIDGQVQSIKECRNLNIEKLSERIKHLKKATNNIKHSKKYKLNEPQTKHKLFYLGQKLDNLVKEKASLIQDKKDKAIRTCFVNNNFFRKQFHLKASGYNSHQEWKKDWDQLRADSIYLVGTGSETKGNQTCQINENLTYLKLRVPDPLREVYRDYVSVPIKLDHNKEHIENALKLKKPITYLFKKHLDGSAYVHVSVERKHIPLVTSRLNGGLGNDLNKLFISSFLVTGDGNPKGQEIRIPLNLQGKRTEQVDAILGEATKRIAEIAFRTQCPVMPESLDFYKKKLKIFKENKQMRKMLSAFAYSKYLKFLKSACQKLGVEVTEVEPEYTSVIGKANWADERGISVHAGAAIVQARRGLEFSEHPKRSVISLVPVRNPGDSNEVYWQEFREKQRASEAALGKVLVFRRLNRRLSQRNMAKIHVASQEVRSLDDCPVEPTPLDEELTSSH